MKGRHHTPEQIIRKSIEAESARQSRECRTSSRPGTAGEISTAA